VGKHHCRAASLTFTWEKCSESKKLLGQKDLPEILKYLEAEPAMSLAADGGQAEPITCAVETASSHLGFLLVWSH